MKLDLHPPAQTLMSDVLLAVEDIHLPFRASRFGMKRKPIPVGKVDVDGFGDLPSCLDMLVKLPAGPLTLPSPYADNPAVKAFMEDALGFEKVIYPEFDGECFLYLTDDQREVVPGRSHRNGGWHFDGMQGARYKEKLPACHQYVVSSALCTEFTDAPTDATGLDENRHNWFECLAEQVPPDAPVIQPEPGEIAFMTAYQLHRSPIATEQTAGMRTFMRLDVSHKKQDRLGNTLNPDLCAPWKFVERNLPEGLGRPRTSTHWDGARKFSETEA